jgi:glycosyltransferase involved in cell wall biosynthesis
VGSELGGIAELIHAAECGLLVPPEEPDALAAALKRILCDHELRRRLESNGAAYAASLSWSAIADRTIAVYRRALGEIG